MDKEITKARACEIAQAILREAEQGRLDAVKEEATKLTCERQYEFALRQIHKYCKSVPNQPIATVIASFIDEVLKSDDCLLLFVEDDCRENPDTPSMKDLYPSPGSNSGPTWPKEEWPVDEREW
jgi:hypothetical protein